MSTCPLTQVEFDGDDFDKAKAIARKLGYRHPGDPTIAIRDSNGNTIGSAQFIGRR